MGQREDILTAAHWALDRYGDAVEAYLAKEIESAHAERDGNAITKWLMVREAVRQLMTDEG